MNPDHIIQQIGMPVKLQVEQTWLIHRNITFVHITVTMQSTEPLNLEVWH